MTDPGFHDQLRAIRYVGAKIRLMVRLRPILKGLGEKVFVDVFGGSGSVTMGCGFDKRVFNDVDGDVVHFFRVLADPERSREMFRWLRTLPMSRELFQEWNAAYVAGGNSFAAMPPVQRAVAFFYRSSFAYGGKIRNGGFAATVSDKNGCKEIKRYRRVLRDLAVLREFWQETVIEHLDFEQIIRGYGNRRDVLLYCDPPYYGTERYYSRDFPRVDHERLAAVAHEVPGRVVLSYYDTPEIRDLYPESRWNYHEIEATKNSMRNTAGGPKERVRELVIVKRMGLHRSLYMQVHGARGVPACGRQAKTP